MKAVVVENLSYRYQAEGLAILKKLSFDIARGEIVVLTGLSGCGKSTLCYCLSGIIPNCRGGIMEGKVLINGKNTRDSGVACLAEEVGMVFQDPDTQLFSPTVEDEIAFAPENMCLSPIHIRERVDYAVDLLGIGSLIEVNPHQLSGGEKHLVALASVLTLDPPVLVLDEVLSQLDHAGRKKVARALEKLRSQGKTIIAVEHDIKTAVIADRIIVMQNGELIRYEPRETLLADRDFLLASRLI
ncbi:energy-coupling factor ABC transporter ATP-binding protein [Syntrophomonas curvata]